MTRVTELTELYVRRRSQKRKAKPLIANGKREAEKTRKKKTKRIISVKGKGKTKKEKLQNHH